ncbi:hypothetical protein BO71DRAFT_20541 [Aspergillus ellipticus CBS 707.79]|uniref:Uncharacterized protein n=1 Tax=Aspergillus ellipticus CBS 707.79 TaxID=1448320 RepID=A0A319D551_9EURO|nr:hypothetical protein BO71DRAFT_20541 [Aspergillus ellipticus CBS 707.79]
MTAPPGCLTLRLMPVTPGVKHEPGDCSVLLHIPRSPLAALPLHLQKLTLWKSSGTFGSSTRGASPYHVLDADCAKNVDTGPGLYHYPVGDLFLESSARTTTESWMMTGSPLEPSSAGSMTIAVDGVRSMARIGWPQLHRSVDDATIPRHDQRVRKTNCWPTTGHLQVLLITTARLRGIFPCQMRPWQIVVKYLAPLARTTI